MKFEKTYSKNYVSNVSYNPEDRGEASASANDNIETLLRANFIEINSAMDDEYTKIFMAQNENKDLFYIEIEGNPPSVGKEKYERTLTLVGFSTNLPKKLVEIIEKEGFKQKVF